MRCAACFDETQLAFSTVRAVYVTRNGGESWDDPSTVTLDDGTFRGTGNSNVTLTGVVMHPEKTDSIYLLGNDEPIWLTEDAGKTLRTFAEFGNCTALEFSPRDPNVFYASRTRGFNHVGHLLKYERSEDSRKTPYTVLARPFENADVSGIQIRGDENTLFVSGVSSARDFKNYLFRDLGGGVAFSADGGISFASVNAGLQHEPHATSRKICHQRRTRGRCCATPHGPESHFAQQRIHAYGQSDLLRPADLDADFLRHFYRRDHLSANLGNHRRMVD